MIPRVVHRIWFGPRPMRQELVDYGLAWEKFGYEVKLWTEANLPPLVNQSIYDRIPDRGVNPGVAPWSLGVWTQRADLVSYELISQFGGIYANCDIEPLKDLHELLDGVSAFAGWENPEKSVLCNALFGATKGHPFMAACIDQAARRWRDVANFVTMQLQTGPGAITSAFDQVEGVTTFPSSMFYPYSFTEMEREHDDWPDAYTSHHWGHTKGDV